ncbi:UvrD-helicase domain-containing protein [Paenibacillus sp. AN1007]|uniref:DNA 3'-5' helicase n=1 Tax=Paenibacillus sp. AN1007 TaxID=3151385 RepID=A0AAU8N7S7_9BACL
MQDIILTKKQQEAVDYEGDQLLIRGIAGSGKTTVLLKQAHKIITKHPDQSIALITYNQTLARYAAELASLLKSDRLKVKTFHSWAYGALSRNGRVPRVLSGKQLTKLILTCRQELKMNSTHRFFRETRFEEFLQDEIKWIKGMGILTRESYMRVERNGRGTKVKVDRSDRDKIFDLFELYQNKLKQEMLCDYDDYALLLKQQGVPQSQKFDNILIDEAQDLQQVQLQLLKNCAGKRIIIAADKGQKIYKTSFSWREIGINITGGRTKILTDSQRSTEQIMRLAASLQQHDPLCKNKDDEFVPPEMPSRQGPKAEIIQCLGYMEEEVFVTNTIAHLRKVYPKWSIGLLSRQMAPFNRYERVLNDKGVDCVQVKKEGASVLNAGVKLMSFHSAKGLEFDAVFIIRVSENSVPFLDKGHDEPDEEELAVERRLLYVSMTRAKSILYMAYYGKPSRFIDEMDSSLYNHAKV